MLKGFGARVRALREKRSLSQQELADMVGLHLSQLGRIERGSHAPSAVTLLALARALRATTDALLRGDRSGEEPLQIENVRLFERFRALQGLPKEEQDTVLRLVDAVLAKHQFEHLAERVKRVG